MKIDIEGHEDKALLPFFEEVNKDLYPEIILIEHTSNENWSLDIISYLKTSKILFFNTHPRNHQMLEFYDLWPKCKKS